MTSGAFSVTSITMDLLGIAMGVLNDKFGPRIVMSICGLLLGIGIGALIGPPAANGLISSYGWRVSYIILGSVVLTVIVLSAQLLKGNPSQMGQVADGEKQSVKKGLDSETEELSLEGAFHTRSFWVFFAMIFFGLIPTAALKPAIVDR